jgi:hypothetical protein
MRPKVADTSDIRLITKLHHSREDEPDKADDKQLLAKAFRSRFPSGVCIVAGSRPGSGCRSSGRPRGMQKLPLCWHANCFVSNSMKEFAFWLTIRS